MKIADKKDIGYLLLGLALAVGVVAAMALLDSPTTGQSEEGKSHAKHVMTCVLVVQMVMIGLSGYVLQAARSKHTRQNKPMQSDAPASRR